MNYNIALIRYLWGTDESSTPTLEGPWRSLVFKGIIASLTNGWSVASYWQGCTFGLAVPVFDLTIALSSRRPLGAPPGWHLWDYQPPRGGGNRGNILNAAISQAHTEGLPQAFNHIVVFVDPPPSDAGAIGGRVLFDEGAFLAYYQHEIGHVLGLQHPFGHEGGELVVYDDPYCIMGFFHKRDFNLPIPTRSSDRPSAPVSWLRGLPSREEFWLAGPRPATATLYRYLPEFAASTSVVHAFPPELVVKNNQVTGGPSEHELVASSDATIHIDPLLVVVTLEFPLPTGSPVGEILIEYRRAKPDDWDRAIGPPVVIVHSVGLARSIIPPENSEVRPVVLEAAIPAERGTAWIDKPLNVAIEVLERSSDDSRVKFWLTTPSMMMVSARIDQQEVFESQQVKIEEGTFAPDPIAGCVFGTYPSSTYGTRSKTKLTPALNGIEQPTYEWWLVIPKYNQTIRLPAPLDTDLQIKRFLRTIRIRAGQEVTSSAMVTLGYRLVSDGTLVVEKREGDGAFTLTVELRVTGSNQQFGTVHRADATQLFFLGDEIKIGGTYQQDVLDCLGQG